MDPENLSEKYELLLQENQLLKERILLLESALKQAGVSLVEALSGDYIESNCAAAPTQCKRSRLQNQKKSQSRL